MRGGTLIFFVGIIDDLKSLPAKVKLACQILCAFILFQFSVRISFIGIPFGEGYYYFPWIVSLLVTVIWIVGITNTINLIDGLDGLAGGVACIASASIAYIAYINGNTEASMAMLAITEPPWASLSSTSIQPRSSWGTAERCSWGLCLRAFP